MNKTLLLGVCMGAALTGAAQSANDLSVKKARSTYRQSPTPVASSANRAIIWSDDFSNASTWTLGDIDDPNHEHWVIGTAGPTGSFSSTYGTIESTSAANGFALFDSDLLCGGSQQAYVQNATAIDLTGYPGAVVQFEQLFSEYRGDCFVDVSANGTDWTAFEVNADVAPNTSTDNPELTTVNISSVAGNQATVWIRFRYYSTVAVHGTGAGCDYAWMVDDVAIVELEPYELVLNYGFISHTGNGEEYGRVPTNQLPTAMNMGAEVYNFGQNAQTGVTVRILITDATAATIFDQTYPVGDIPAADTVLLDEMVTLPTLADGIYDVTFTTTSNEAAQEFDPTNNTVPRKFAVDDDVYALDGIDVYATNELSATGSDSFLGAEDGLEVMTYYKLTAPAMIYGVSAQLANGTEVNSAVIVSVYDSTDAVGGDYTSPLAQTDLVNVDAADLAAGRVLGLFPAAANLPAGSYYAAVRLYSGAGQDHIRILDDNTVPQPGGASIIYDPSDQTVYGGNGNAYAVRLELSATVGMNESPVLEGITMYPNPTTGVLRVNTSGTGIYAIEITDVLGKVVLNDRIQGNGTIDLGSFDKGLYVVRVSNTAGAMVQRVTLD